MLTTSLRCRSLSDSNIRCNNCYQSIVVPKCGTRYYCMSKQCVDFCEQCFTDAGVLHEHDRFLRIDGETGKHGPVTREVGVGVFSLDMLTHGTFSPGDAAYVPAWQRRSTQRNSLTRSLGHSFVGCTICEEAFNEGDKFVSMPPCRGASVASRASENMLAHTDMPTLVRHRV